MIMASQHGVATSTVQQALRILKRDGLVKSVPRLRHASVNRL
jgi:DNA-binding transcriptional regulator YhcF (GntR family)